MMVWVAEERIRPAQSQAIHRQQKMRVGGISKRERSVADRDIIPKDVLFLMFEFNENTLQYSREGHRWFVL